MKTAVKAVTVSGIIIAAVAFIILVTTPTRLHIKPNVYIHSSNGPQQLDITTPGSPNCKDNPPQNGCVAVGENNTAQITFTLTGPKAWNFTSIRICAGNNKPNDSDADCTPLLTQQQQDEFYVKDGTIQIHPDNKGLINLTSISADTTELRTFILYDQNEEEGDYFYTIKACNPAHTATCKFTDPPIENGGRFDLFLFLKHKLWH